MKSNKVFFSRRGLSLILVVLTVLAFAIVLMVSPAAGESQENPTDADEFAMIRASGDFTPANAGKGQSEGLGDSVEISRNSATGYASFVAIEPGSLRLPIASDASSVEKANAFLTEYGAVFGISDAEKELTLTGVETTLGGNEHVSYQQYYKGIPAFAGVLRVHFNGAGELTAANGTFIPDIRVETPATLTAAEAEAIAVAAVPSASAERNASSDLAAANTELVVYRTGLAQRVPGENYLAYEVEVVNSSVSIREFVYVEAHSGAIVDRISGIYSDLDREVSEASLATVVWDESAGDPDPIPSGWAGGTAQQVTDWNNEIDGAKETYNLFASMAGWDSYDNTGSTMRTVNNDPGINCPNASWNGTSTNYCSDVTGDDTVAHEWGHAYTQFTNNLVYAWQSGALNESYSDIWGEVVDLLNNRDLDTPDLVRAAGYCSSNDEGANFPTWPEVDTVRWLSGESDPAFDGIPSGSGNAIRDMWEPGCFGDPGYVTDANYWCTAEDGGGVHTNSGVPNRAFALMVDGEASLGITALGLTKSAHIEWAAQNILTMASDFVDNADALELACSNLIDIDLPALSTSISTTVSSGEVITDTDCAEVTEIISTVEFRTPPDQCNFQPMLDPDAPALCEGVGDFNSIDYTDWESGLGEWITGTRDVANPATFDTPDWAVVTPLPDNRDGSAAFVLDSPLLGDCQDDDETGVLYLESPTITLPIAAIVPRIAVDHWNATEATWDGGNFKISVNGGPWTLIPSSNFSFNAYNSVLSSTGNGNTNPMASEEAFTGTDGGSPSGSWGQSQIKLLGLAAPGDDIQLRVEMGLDGCNGVIGWFVDDVDVYYCSDELPGLCGDGILDQSETCDDGNTDAGDGCSATCQVEDGWICEDPQVGFIDPSVDEGFESGLVPPPGWTTVVTNSLYTWEVSTSADEGSYSAMVVWDPTVAPQDEWLISPEFTPAADSALQFATMGSPYWCRDTFDNCDVEVWLVVGDLGGSDDVFVGLADDAWPDGVPFIWAKQSFDLTNLLPGGPVKLAYHYAALDGAQANVDTIQLGEFVDNPSVCRPLASVLACNVDPVDFDAGIPGNWTVVNNEDPGLVWTDLTGCGESGNFTNGSGDAACVSSDKGGFVEYDTELWSNPFSLTDVASPTLEYTANFRNLDTDLLDVDISINGGISWTNLLSWNDDFGGFRTPPGVDVSLDLSDYVGMEDLLVRWHYYNPDEGDWDWYVQVDDVSLSCEVPVIDVDPESLESTQYPDVVVTKPMTIANLGAADLDWSIAEFEPVMYPVAKSPEPLANPITAGEQSFSTASDDTVGAAIFSASVPDGMVMLTHSLSQTIEFPNSVACGTGGLHADNSYLRVFDLASFGILTDFDIDTVQIGIQTAVGADGTQPASMNLYLWDPNDTFTFGNFNLVGSSPLTVYDADELSIISVPVAGTAPAGSTLVVEFFTPEGQSAGNSMWVGSNSFGQTGPTYLAAAACGLPEPTDVAAIGVPNMHLVMNVIGDAECASIADIPWASVDPITGTTTALGNTVVDVTFDSTGYSAGTYDAGLCVFSNDPVTPIVTVPLTLEVEELYEIDLDKTVGTDPATCAASDYLYLETEGESVDVYYCYDVTNMGTTTLTMHTLVDSELGTLLLDEPYDLGPGESVNTLEMGEVISASVSATTVNTATWTAYDASQGSAFDVSTATVEVTVVSITLDKTVGTDPATCAASDYLNLQTEGESVDVYYCYEVTNTGDVTFTMHSLIDSELGQLLTDETYDLGPGESVNTVELGEVISASVSATTVNTATWAAYVEEVPSAGEGPSAEASATATVNVMVGSISLEKTVGLLPGICASQSAISFNPGDADVTVYYCYEVTNTGEVTFTMHSLIDSELGQLLTFEDYELGPGETVNTVEMGEVFSVTITSDVVNTATWTAWTGDEMWTEATATASVILQDPTGVTLASFGEVSPLDLTPVWLAALVSVSILGASLIWRKRKNQ